MSKTKLTLITIISFVIIFFVQACLGKPNKFNFEQLKKSYNYYKKHYVSDEGRVMDPDRNNITVSEGQSYMLFMSLVVNDKKTFDLVYDWTKNNLGRKDGLYSWKWGKNEKGEYKVLDSNSATDADIHIARALIKAYEKWKKEEYLDEAMNCINGIWRKETKRVGKHRVLMPGAVQTQSPSIMVNPSYFTPYSFRVFKKYDKRHNWNELIDSSYYYLFASSGKTATKLPPNWFFIKNGEIVLEGNEHSDFSYDAIRCFWFIYSDYRKSHDPRAYKFLTKSRFFIKKWKETGNLYVNYKANGELRDKNKFIGSISILIPAINLFDKKVSDEIFQKEITPYFNEDGFYENPKDYYGKNLLWFGKYMYITKDFLR